MDVSSLPRILIDIGVQEMRDISIDVKEDRISSVAKKQLTHFVTQPPNAKAWTKTSKLESILESNTHELENEMENTPEKPSESSLGSVKSNHQIVTIDMNDSPTHPHLEVRPA